MSFLTHFEVGSACKEFERKGFFECSVFFCKHCSSSISDASRARDTRYLASFSTSPQFGIFGAFGRRRDPACLQNGGAPVILRESFNFIIMKAIFGRFFSEKCYFI